MDFRQLQYVLTIAKEKSFSKAATKLYITQPSLSQTVSKLEENLGIQLFDRTVIPLKLTYAGELFVASAKKLLDIKDQLDKQIQDVNDFKSGRLTLAVSYNRGTYMLPLLLPVFHKKFPDIELNVIEGTSPELEYAVTEGLADIAINSRPIQSKDLTFELIQNEKIVLALSPNHPLVLKYQNNKSTDYLPFPLSELAKENFILLRQGQSMRDLADKIFKEVNIKPKIFVETKSYETSLALAKTGLGITFAVMSMLQDGLSYFTIGQPNLTKPLHISYSNKRYLSEVAQEFIKITKEVFSK